MQEAWCSSSPDSCRLKPASSVRHFSSYGSKHVSSPVTRALALSCLLVFKLHNITLEAANVLSLLRQAISDPAGVSGKHNA